MAPESNNGGSPMSSSHSESGDKSSKKRAAPESDDADAPQKITKRRAARACVSCRARKVRCDVVEGAPCGNCRWDNVEVSELRCGDAIAILISLHLCYIHFCFIYFFLLFEYLLTSTAVYCPGEPSAKVSDYCSALPTLPLPGVPGCIRVSVQLGKFFNQQPAPSAFTGVLLGSYH